MKFPFRKPRQCDPGVATFPELVFAHFLRQREAYAAVQSGAPNAERALHGPAQEEYQHCLRSFTRRHGEIVDAYWTTREISGVALTERTTWGWRGIWPHRGRVTRLHHATDWATRDAPAIASELHACESLAIRANEVLLGTSERIVMQLLLALVSRLLAVVDGDEPPAPSLCRRVVEESRKQLAEIRSYYDRAGQKAVRVFYTGGMLFGLTLLGAGLLVAWRLGANEVLLVTLGMGAVGAVASVLQRMARRESRFNLDHEVGQSEARRLGTFRPFLGASFGALVYLAVLSGFVEFAAVTNKTPAFYAVIAFLAGFSERWVKVVLDLAPDDGDEKRTQARAQVEAATPPRPQPPPPTRHEEEDPDAVFAGPLR